MPIRGFFCFFLASSSFSRRRTANQTKGLYMADDAIKSANSGATPSKTSNSATITREEFVERKAKIFFSYPFDVTLRQARKSWNEEQKAYPPIVSEILRRVLSLILAKICKCEEDVQSYEEEIEQIKRTTNCRFKHTTRKFYEEEVEVLKKKKEAWQNFYKNISYLLNEVENNRF